MHKSFTKANKDRHLNEVKLAATHIPAYCISVELQEFEKLLSLFSVSELLLRCQCVVGHQQWVSPTSWKYKHLCGKLGNLDKTGRSQRKQYYLCCLVPFSFSSPKCCGNSQLQSLPYSADSVDRHASSQYKNSKFVCFRILKRCEKI